MGATVGRTMVGRMFVGGKAVGAVVGGALVGAPAGGMLVGARADWVGKVRVGFAGGVPQAVKMITVRTTIMLVSERRYFMGHFLCCKRVVVFYT